MTFRLVSRSFSDHESNLCSILPSTMSAHAGLKRRSWFASMWCSPTFCEPKWHTWLPFGPKCQAIWCPFQLRPPILPSPWFSDDALLRLGISVWKKFFRSSRGFGHSWLKRTRRPGSNAVLTLLERSGQDGSSNPRCLDPFRLVPVWFVWNLRWRIESWSSSVFSLKCWMRPLWRLLC